MHSSPASRSKPRPRRKAPIATLIALSALAAGAQTLAPASATAMDDQGGAAECRSFAGAPPGAGWNGTEFCTLTDGSAGGGGGAGGSSGDGSGGGLGSGGGTVGNEVIVIVDPYSPPKSTNPPCKNARLCLPGQSGDGRPLGIEGDGPSRGGPRAGGGTGSGKKKEAPGPKKLGRKQCLALKATGKATPLSADPGAPYDPVLDLVDEIEKARRDIEKAEASMQSLTTHRKAEDGYLKELLTWKAALRPLKTRLNDLWTKFDQMLDARKAWRDGGCASFDRGW